VPSRPPGQFTAARSARIQRGSRPPPLPLDQQRRRAARHHDHLVRDQPRADLPDHECQLAVDPAVRDARAGASLAAVPVEPTRRRLPSCDGPPPLRFSVTPLHGVCTVPALRDQPSTGERFRIALLVMC